MSGMQKHYVEFLSRGTFVSESTTREIDSWNVDAAVSMAKEIVEQHGARPYGFRFVTRVRKENDLDAKVIGSSPMHYLGGTIRAADEVLAGTDPSETVLRLNVRINGIKRIIVNDNSWRFIAELKDDDVVLDFVMPPRAA